MKRIDEVPARSVRISKADGTPYPKDDWRTPYQGCMGMLGIYESMERYPGKKAGYFSAIVVRGDAGELGYVPGCRLQTSVGEVRRDGSRIAIETANSIYEFEELADEELVEYMVFASLFSQTDSL